MTALQAAVLHAEQSVCVINCAFGGLVIIRKAGGQPPAFSQGYQDSNLELTESESVALPFGDIPLRRCHYKMPD